MNVERVYTPPTSITRGRDHWTGGFGKKVNIGRVYTPPIFIAKGKDP